MGQVSMVEKLRQQRDRFIAFAFAGADLLLEMDEGDNIVFSAGAGESLYGVADGDLQGRPLADFIFPRDLQRFKEALQRLRNTGRLDHTPLTLMGTAGTVTRMRLAGIRLPQFPESYHLALSRIPPIAPYDEERNPEAADPKARFVEMVQQRLNESNRIGQEYHLTLFDLSGNFDQVEPGTAQSFLATLHHTLEECSVRGASAGILSDRSFGLVHDDKVSAQQVQKRVHQLTEKFKGKVSGAQVQMRSATLDMEDSALSDEDIGKALNFIVTNFVRDSAQFAIKSLADGARTAIDDTLVRVRNFRKMVKADRLVFLFQPIVNLRTGAVLKYEAFARITHNGGFFLPHQIIPFATDVGLIGEFDLAACNKALAMMKAASEVSPLANISVNVSGHSLGNPGFYQALFKLLEANKGLLNRLVIEVTDAARIHNLNEAKRLLSRLRKLGARISLDDFGSRGSAFDLLRILPVDYAKIDAEYVLDARDPRGRSVLKAITGMCQELGITTVGECVEDAEMVRILRDVGVDYAQGHYFAKPNAEAARKIKYFTERVQEAGTAEPGLAQVG
ncbi:MAG: EAL domain-containing protein [Solirubrobacterales bacterium]